MGSDSTTVTLYNICRGLSPKEERVLRHALMPEVRASLWRHHLLKHLDDPALSQAQRTVIEEGLELLSAPAWSTILPGHPEWSSKEDRLREHRLHAEAVFSKERIVELFFTFRNVSVEDLGADRMDT